MTDVRTLPLIRTERWGRHTIEVRKGYDPEWGAVRQAFWCPQTQKHIAVSAEYGAVDIRRIKIAMMSANDKWESEQKGVAA